MKKGKWQAGILCMAFLCFAGCGGSGSADSSSQAAMDTSNSYAGGIYSEESMEAPTEEALTQADSAVSVASNRKLVKTVAMEVETQEFDTLVKKVENKVETLGGYIESLNLYNGSSYSGTQTKSAEMKVRIPKDQMDSFITEVSKISNVIRREESVEDITLQYVDTESRKKALEIEQERLLALLETAEDLESIIALESRLSQIRYELQNMESQLRTYDNLVDYATIRLSISEVNALTPIVELSAWEKMSTGFMKSLDHIKIGFENFFIGLIISLPYLVVLGILLLLVGLLVLFIIKAGNRKQAKKLAGYQNNTKQPDRKQSITQTEKMDRQQEPEKKE